MDTRFQSLSPLISRIAHHALLKISLCLNKPMQQLVRIVRIGTSTEYTHDAAHAPDAVINRV